MGALLFADGPASSEVWSEAALFPEDILAAKTNQTQQQTKALSKDRDHHMTALDHNRDSRCGTL